MRITCQPSAAVANRGSGGEADKGEALGQTAAIDDSDFRRTVPPMPSDVTRRRDARAASASDTAVAKIPVP